MTKADPPPSGRGFSLVELMVALVIIGLAATAVMLTLPGPAATLDDEASQFAARAAALRDRAVIEARPMRLWVSASGYGFEMRRGNAWVPLEGRTLAADDWPAGVEAAWNGAAGGRIAFDRLGLPDSGGVLVIADDNVRRSVAIDAAGNVRIGTGQ